MYVKELEQSGVVLVVCATASNIQTAPCTHGSHATANVRDVPVLHALCLRVFALRSIAQDSPEMLGSVRNRSVTGAPRIPGLRGVQGRCI